MKANDRNIVFVIAGLVLVLAFWFLFLGPKRHQASDLSSKASTLQASVEQEQQKLAYGQQARQDFPRDYTKLVLLGKAAPENADSASWIVQLNQIARTSKVDFRGMELAPSAPQAAATTSTAPAQPGLDQAPATTSQPSTSDPSATSSSSTSSTASTSPATPPATEASASTLAIGAQVGPAGLSVLPYKLSFAGSFFNVANFMQGVDRLVQTSGGRTVVDGRLSTVDGFSLSQNPAKGFPALDASIFVTTYLAPSDQGLTGGASAGGPAPSVPSTAPVQTASVGGSQ